MHLEENQVDEICKKFLIYETRNLNELFSDTIKKFQWRMHLEEISDDKKYVCETYGEICKETFGDEMYAYDLFPNKIFEKCKEKIYETYGDEICKKI